MIIAGHLIIIAKKNEILLQARDGVIQTNTWYLDVWIPADPVDKLITKFMRYAVKLVESRYLPKIK